MDDVAVYKFHKYLENQDATREAEMSPDGTYGYTIHYDYDKTIYATFSS